MQQPWLRHSLRTKVTHRQNNAPLVSNWLSLIICHSSFKICLFFAFNHIQINFDYRNDVELKLDILALNCRQLHPIFIPCHLNNLCKLYSTHTLSILQKRLVWNALNLFTKINWEKKCNISSFDIEPKV